MTYTEQLEREAEITRTHLSANLDELRGRLSPANVVDRLVGYVQDGSGRQFFHNLKRQIANNPLPVTLIGAGVAWLVMANGRASNGHATHTTYDGQRTSGERRAGERARRALGQASDSVSETSDELSARVHDGADRLRDAAAAGRDRLGESRDRLGNSIRSTASSVRDTAEESYQATRDAAAGAYERASDAYEQVTDQASRTAAAMAGSIRSLGRGTAQTGQSLAEFCREQPLVIAGLGLAVGAAIGAALPSTDTEDRMMGEASEDAKRKMREIASDAVDHAAAAGEQTLDAARDAVEGEVNGLMDDYLPSDDGSRDPSDAQSGAQAGDRSGGGDGPRAASDGTSTVRSEDDDIPRTSIGEPDETQSVAAGTQRTG